MTGTTILHYIVGEKLGAGGMGEVYRAEDSRLGRSVALKFLSPAQRSDPEKRWRLLQEARAASALRSPHIAVTYDVVEEGEHLFIVMEYVEGELLSRKLERGPLPIRDAVDISLQTADALDEAHSHGIIHRDIKGSNLIITARGLVKVLDFGIAKLVAPPNGATRTGDALRTDVNVTAPGVVLGTVSYMSPEQALGRVLDHRSDIFSLGVLMYQMVTGKLPFVGESLTEVIDQILHRDPPPAALLNSEVPAQVSLMIQRAMEKDIQFRWPSAGELCAGLRRVARALEPEEWQSGLDGDPSRTGTVSAMRSASGSAGDLASTENAVAVLTFSNITKEPADDWIGTGIAETVTADLQSVHGLSVIGRARIFETLKSLSSSEVNALDERMAMELGRRLGATWLLRGAYQRVGSFIRITAHFSEARTGKLLKTVKVDGQLSDIFHLQDKIVYELTQGLNLKLHGSEIAEIERKETSSVEAYECYSRGMLNLRSGNRDSLDRAVHLFEKALELDPVYASAWAGLASAYTLKGSFLGLPGLFDKAVGFARRSIALNPRLSNAHAWLGAALGNLGSYDEAIQAIGESIRLEPKNAVAHLTLARVYWVGKGMIAEGIAELEKCVELNPEFGHAYLQLGFLHALRRDLDRAEAACRKAVELQEKLLSGSEGLQIVGAHARLGYVHYLRGSYDEAIREYERELAFLARSDHALRERTLIELQQKLGAAWIRKGDRAEADRNLERAVKAYESRLQRGSDDPFTKYYIACVYALRGDADSAVKYLAESMEQLRALNTLRARTDPDLGSLRDNMTFQELIENKAQR